MRRTLTLLFLVVGLAGCIPGRVQKVSEVSGSVRRGQAPVDSVSVVWKERHLGDGGTTVRETKTDSLGSFFFEGEEGWGVWILLPAHGFINWKIEIRHGGTVWSFLLQEYGPQWPPERVRFDCDLDRDGDFCRLLEPTYLRLDSMEVVFGEGGANASIQQ
jgi:hypothetical protein